MPREFEDGFPGQAEKGRAEVIGDDFAPGTPPVDVSDLPDDLPFDFETGQPEDVGSAPEFIPPVVTGEAPETPPPFDEGDPTVGASGVLADLDIATEFPGQTPDFLDDLLF